MEKIVVDTNIVFSAILNTNSKIGDMLLNSEGIFEFYSASYLKDEIANHHSKLHVISNLIPEKIEVSINEIFKHIHFIAEDLIPFKIWHHAAQIVRDVDMDDIAFVALSEHLNCKLWTGDKKLRRGIIEKGFQKSITTEELFEWREELEKE
ncbi:MAG: PIN domain-containing protein [Chitinophagales bacterium]|nr:PIN domain-containing protein [Chitinophagales bacterium]